MSDPVVTVVDAQVDPDREADLVAGYVQISDGERPRGLLRSELLRGQDGWWRIQTTWQDMDALRAVRASGVRPAAIDLLERVGAGHSHAWFTVERSYGI